ncbi:unnamed protein product [Adineta steineri]|uniref:AIG1-type G domain-containing protein n=1 Tax=Adineta steineri TaxID=433720 RepID=A0A814DRL9_9BILA|nr:unnamed protein product [Adineta steineri]CAF1035755.1 unnamed protein product [Adineta steineri]CAF3820455.1 unnamed protein product [Adineta steineri]CAF3983927.1 unnamed protein product [Adineta steineri]
MADQPSPYSVITLRAKYATIDNTNKDDTILTEIRQEYQAYGKYPMKEVEHKNILLIGRTRTGKSTIKSLLVNPTNVPNELTLKSGTKESRFQSFHLQEDDVVLNITDTSGLFEHSNKELEIRDNEMILKTIGFCINIEITKFHAICFCVFLTTGINQEDIQALSLLIDYLVEFTTCIQ